MISWSPNEGSLPLFSDDVIPLCPLWVWMYCLLFWFIQDSLKVSCLLLIQQFGWFQQSSPSLFGHGKTANPFGCLSFARVNILIRKAANIINLSKISILSSLSIISNLKFISSISKNKRNKWCKWSNTDRTVQGCLFLHLYSFCTIDPPEVLPRVRIVLFSFSNYRVQIQHHCHRSLLSKINAISNLNVIS